MTDRVSIPPHVIARTVGEDTVILDLSTGSYFGLDPVGARIWQLMGEGRTIAEICESMQGEFEVSREELERDTVELAEELIAQGLVTVVE